MAPALECLEIDHTTYRLIPGTIHAALSRPVPTLRALILHPRPAAAGHASNCAPVIPAPTWAQVIGPLLSQLTHLDIGSRSFEGVSCTNSTASEDVSTSVGLAAAAAAGSQQLAAYPPPADGGGALRHLLQLSCSGLDGPTDDAWCLTWVSSCRSLTSLHIRLCSAGELDCDVLAQLQQLQSLTIHHYEDEFVTAAQLGPLSACCRLTQLQLEGLLLELPAPDQPHAAAGQAPAAPLAAALDPAAAAAGAHAGAADGTRLLGSHSSVCLSLLPQLTSLQRLTANLLPKAPVTILAPNLTRLKDVSFLCESTSAQLCQP